MSRTLFLVAVIVSLGACSRGAGGSEETGAEPVEVLPPSEGQVAAPDSDEVSDVGAVVPTGEGSQGANAEAAPARDLGSELRAAVGSLLDCLKDYRPSTAKTIPVQISGIVRPTGMVIEPSASGPGLSNNDRACMADRVGAVTLPPLSDGASVPVSTTVSLQYQPNDGEEIKESDVGGPPPDLPDVVEALPKRPTIPPSGVPIDGPKGDPIEGPKGDPIEGPAGVPVEGPKPMPIDGYEVDQEAERWTDD